MLNNPLVNWEQHLILKRRVNHHISPQTIAETAVNSCIASSGNIFCPRWHLLKYLFSLHLDLPKVVTGYSNAGAFRGETFPMDHLCSNLLLPTNKSDVPKPSFRQMQFCKPSLVHLQFNDSVYPSPKMPPKMAGV